VIDFIDAPVTSEATQAAGPAAETVAH